MRVVLLTFGGGHFHSVEWMRVGEIDAFAERQMPDCVREIERRRGIWVHVVDVNVVQREALAGRYVEASAHLKRDGDALELADSAEEGAVR